MMTQRIFDIDNEEDMKLLWSVLPDDVNKIKKHTDELNHFYRGADIIFTSLIKINWHDATEITRPIQEATEQDIGKLCYFWDDNTSNGTYCILVEVESGMYKSKRKGYYEHCRRLTKQEIEKFI